MMNNEPRGTAMNRHSMVCYWLGAISGVLLGFGVCTLTHDLNRPAAAGTWEEYYAAQSAHSLREMQLEQSRRNQEERLDRYDRSRSPC